MKARILLLGKELSDFTNDLSDRTRRQGHIVDILELRGVPQHRRQHYDRVVEAPSLAFRHYGVLPLLRAGIAAHTGANILRSLGEDPAPGKWLEYGRESVRGSLMGKWASKLFRDYDLINFHYMTPDALRFLPFVPEGTKVVTSFWGDDLLHSPPRVALSQLHALERADVITVHSGELREILLAKYGRHLARKVRTVLFGVSRNVVGRIEQREGTEARARFLHRHGIEPGKVLVAVGYNASHRHNHAQVIEQLAKLPAEVKDDLVVVMAMTYSHYRQAYPDQMERLASESGLKTLILQKFMSEEELADMRLACDLMLLIADSDGLSSSLVESLWAGSVAVVGSWLPYGPLRAAGTYMREVSRFEQLPKLVHDLLSDLPEQKRLASENRARLGFLNSAEQASNWLSIYEEVLGQGNEG